MQQAHSPLFMLSGGGTGGHIYPAIAIADELKKQIPNARLLFVGAKGRMEMEKIPQVGYPIIGLDIQGISRTSLGQNLSLPFKLFISLVKAYALIRKYKPTAVIGTGGYASAPLLKMAQWCGVPYFVQEQNSYPGIVNKWVAKGAQRIFTAYSGLEAFFPKEKILQTGNPLRANIGTSVPTAEDFSFFGLQSKAPVLFVMGGSLGAKRINELIASKLSFLEQIGVQVLWQCGKAYYQQYAHLQSDRVKIMPFVENMKRAYATASVIISRAGASSVSELCAVAKPVIFIPSPNVAEDHQTKNAQAIAHEKAAIVLAEAELDNRFEEVFSALMHNSAQRAHLSEQISLLARPNATEQIVTQIIKDLHISNGLLPQK